jgi:hypothetical protein
MKKILLILAVMIAFATAHSQEISLPLESNHYAKPTSYSQLSEFVAQLDSASGMMKAEIIGQSVNGRNLYAMKFSSGEFGADKSKIRVLFFAQQHGNEQSGKEAALKLALSLCKPENSYLFDKIDLAIIPQVNPDGSELNQRRNAHEMDLNRNHLILTEPEIQALHRLFEKYLFEVTMDVHEYSPFGDDWKKYGYRKNADVTLGVTTNVNVSEKIREFSNKVAAPYVMKYISDRGFSSFVYCPGGPPGVDYIRHSTFDINDGRQSLGILNSLSFIQEGMNGEDTYVENLQHRTDAQVTGMKAMLEFVYLNSAQIQMLVADGRKNLLSAKAGKPVSVQASHFSDGRKLMLPLVSWNTKTDTVVEVTDYRPVVKSTYDIDRPLGYLVPKKNTDLVEWLSIQNITQQEYTPGKHPKVEHYYVRDIDSIDFERDMIVNPIVESSTVNISDPAEYIFVPAAQLKANMIVQALEPKSMLGLITYKQYAGLLKTATYFPVLRVIK